MDTCNRGAIVYSLHWRSLTSWSKSNVYEVPGKVATAELGLSSGGSSSQQNAKITTHGHLTFEINLFESSLSDNVGTT
eukprot:4071832-Amphidinium_carterae.1